ncbi:MAG TPA: CopD family protein, partial [Gemmatimonadaceae bacterium]
RLLEFIALLLVLGVFVFVHGVLPPLAARGVHTTDASLSARTLGSGAATIYIAAAIGRLLMEAAELRMPGEATASVLPGISDSSWGHGWVVGVVGAGLVVIGLLLSRRRIAAGTPIALTGALAMALSPALTGHAASAQWFVASVTLDGLHVASVGSWLGTLAVVVLIGIPAMARVKDGNADAAVSALVNSFHPIALLSAPMAVFAGLGSSALRLGSLAALTSSRYGSVLIWKLGAVALVAAMGTWNSTRARKRLGTPSATQGIRWTAATEVILAVLVLWVTTDLTATPAPSEMVAP